jgi:hypothetical protein
MDQDVCYKQLKIYLVQSRITYQINNLSELVQQDNYYGDYLLF